MEQGTEEWFKARLGKVTASRVADVVAKTKSGWGASRANYEAQLIAEILTGTVADSYTNAAMQHGTETEPKARAAYEFLHDVDVELIGFVDHPTIAQTGASPDGIVGKGMLEIKCPQPATHIDTLLKEKVPKKYITQMQWQMACCEKEWCDFMSYDDRLPVNLNTFICRIERDDKLIDELQTEVQIFLDEMNEKIERLQNLEPDNRISANSSA